MARGRPNRTDLPNIHNRIREVRLDKGLTLAGLSKLTTPRVPASTIQRHESGAGVDTRYLEIYGRALGCKPEELLATTASLSARERALLGLFAQLTDWDKDRFIKLGHTLAESAEPFEPERRRR